MHAATERAKDVVRRGLGRLGYDVMRAEEGRFRVASPSATRRRPDVRRLEDLRARYAATPFASDHTYWDDERVASIDPERFRDHSMFVWQYEERPRNTELRYFTYLRQVESLDTVGMLDRLAEDGAFGAPVFEFPGRRPISRDVLDSVNEILYLDRRLGLLSAPEVRVLDIGAGYGRLAHRMAEVVPGLVDYACADAIPESTYLCEHYLAERGVAPPARVIELPDAEHEITSGRFDVAVNIHSFSEMPRRSVERWMTFLAASDVPALLVIPNAPTAIRSFEAGGGRLDLLPVIESAGFTLDHREAVIDDPAARELVGVHDHFHFFRRTEG